MMGMGKPAQIYRLLGAVALRTIEGRSDERVNHFDQCRGADHRVKRVKHRRLDRGNVPGKKPIGDIAPLLALKVMGRRLLTLRLMTQMRMVPRETQRLEDLLRHLSKEWGIHHFGLLRRDEAIVKMRLYGWKDVVQGGLIHRCEQLKTPGALRIPSFFCTKLSL